MLKGVPGGAQLTVSVGTFVNSQMCDGLAELSTEGEGRVSAIPVDTTQHALDMISKAEIPNEYEQILYQFSYRTVADFTSIGSLSIMVTKEVDGDTAKLLAAYREMGQVSPKKSGSKPNVLCDTLRAYAEPRSEHSPDRSELGDIPCEIETTTNCQANALTTVLARIGSGQCSESCS
eukprot:sb/3471849/